MIGMILRSITEVMKIAHTAALGVLVDIEHMTLKIEAAKVCSKIGSTTVRRYAEKRITPLRTLAGTNVRQAVRQHGTALSFRQKI